LVVVGWGRLGVESVGEGLLLGGYIRLWDFMGIGYKVMGLWFNFFWF